MMTKPKKTLELRYPMFQFLIKSVIKLFHLYTLILDET